MDFDDWYELFESGSEDFRSETRDELEEAIENAPTDEAREAAEDDLQEYLDGLEDYDGWFIFEQLKDNAVSNDEWSRVQDAYESLTGYRHKQGRN